MGRIGLLVPSSNTTVEPEFYRALPKDVTLTNNTGAHGPKAEESCLMGLLMLQSRLPEILRNQQNHVWDCICTTPIAGKTVVVVGFGDLGQGARRAAKKLGMQVIAVTRSGTPHRLADRVFFDDVLDDQHVLPFVYIQMNVHI